MPKKLLLETGFLLSLNPRDKNHEWAMSILEGAVKGDYLIAISQPALIEFSLLLKSYGLSNDKIGEALQSISSIFNRYTRPTYIGITPETLVYSIELRRKYEKLTFFDSIYAAQSIIHRLIYSDLDKIVKEVISNEVHSR